jgi:hypothetical protein
VNALPVGVGRFVAGPAARRDLVELQGEEGVEVLWEMIESNKGNRRAVQHRFTQLYSRPDGSAATEGDLDSLIRRHDLGERFRVRQSENLRFLFGFHKGARAKVAQALLVDLAAMDALIQELGMKEEVEAMRERYRVTVRDRLPLPERLRLVLSREKYLADLGILPEVDRAVEQYVRDAFARNSSAAPAASAVEERVRRELALDPEAMRRLVRRYRLFGYARSLLVPPAPVAENRPEIR